MEPFELEGGDWRVRFVRQGDRFAHTVEQCVEDTWRTLLTSLEGTSDDVWPASPPWQHVHFETREGRRLALLVGQSGQSHWSASVEFDSEGNTLTFDIACRLRGTPGWLGSSYATELNFCPQAGSPGSFAAPECCLTVAGMPSEESYVACEAGRLTIQALVPPAPLPQTVRWQYRFALTRRQADMAAVN